MSEGVWPHRSAAGTEPLRKAGGRETPMVQEEETCGIGTKHAKSKGATPLLTASSPKVS